MAGKFLIDVTDARFLIPANRDVMEFVRKTNPFAHSDIGSRLLDLHKELPGTHAYCPSYGSCAYVVLHTNANRIFGIAYGQRGLALRLAAPAYTEALEDGGVPALSIGPDWLAFAAYDGPRESGAYARLQRWSARAFTDAGGEAPQGRS
ncbi:MAG: hypothetical protein ABJE47_20080 [bacterium]